MPRIILFLMTVPVFLFGMLIDVHSQEPVSAASPERLIDWQEGTIRIILEEPLGGASYNRPVSAYQAEQRISDRLPQAALRALLNIRVDSWTSFADLARENPTMLRSLEQISERSRRISLYPDRDLGTMNAEFEILMYPELTDLVVRHRSPFPMEKVLSWQPSSDYTGLVIYAAGELPVHGEFESNGEPRETGFEPVLFPVLYDSGLRLILDRSRMDPEFARQWGGAAFSHDGNEEIHRDRIGGNPFRIAAEGLFGLSPSDLIIPESDADILLYSPELRQLLQEGRILVIY